MGAKEEMRAKIERQLEFERREVSEAMRHIYGAMNSLKENEKYFKKGDVISLKRITGARKLSRLEIQIMDCNERIERIENVQAQMAQEIRALTVFQFLYVVKVRIVHLSTKWVLRKKCGQKLRDNLNSNGKKYQKQWDTFMEQWIA